MEKSAIFSYGMQVKQKRKQNWADPEEMDAFLNLLEDNCQQLSQLKRNFAIYNKMSSKMMELGFHREPVELRKKLSNIICKYKVERTQSYSEWPYLERVGELLMKMKRFKYVNTLSDEQEEKVESSPEKSKSEKQKSVFASPKSNRVHIEEADMETILKAMNGEDLSTTNDDSDTGMEIIDNENLSSKCKYIKHENDDSMSNDAPETSNQLVPVTDTPGNGFQTKQLAMKSFNRKKLVVVRKIVDLETTKSSPETATCLCNKDEVELYTALLATKLRSLDNKYRQLAMNKIDNILFKVKMEQIEDKIQSQNSGS